MVDGKLNKEAKQVLQAGLEVLEHAMELAAAKEDLEAMIAISDRLMLLYQHLSDKNPKKFKTGFALTDTSTRDKHKEDEDDESD
jgi:hypothetical protein